jgi:hypothetical protein
MRVVKLGGGAVGFEPEESADRVGNLDPGRLREKGWSDQAVRIYELYRNPLDFLKRARTLGVGRPTKKKTP